MAFNKEGDVKKFRTILVTAALAFTVGVFAGDTVLKGHPNLQKARHMLSESQHWIGKSQDANEKVWGVEGGHAQRAKDLISQAKKELDLAAEWVNSHVQK